MNIIIGNIGIEIKQHLNQTVINKGFDTYNIICFSNGAAFTIDGKDIAIKQSCLIVYDKNTAQNFRFIKSDTITNWIHFDFKGENSIMKYSVPLNTPVYCDSTAIGNFIKSIFTQSLNHEIFWKEYSDNLLDNLLICIRRSFSNITSSKASEKELVYLREQIYFYPETQWTIDKMTEMTRFSRSMLHRAYKYSFGVTPLNDVISARITKAKYLLQYTQLSVAEISNNVGYASEYHFIRQFKQKTGCSPLKYRIGTIC